MLGLALVAIACGGGSGESPDTTSRVRANAQNEPVVGAADPTAAAEITESPALTAEPEPDPTPEPEAAPTVAPTVAPAEVPSSESANTTGPLSSGCGAGVASGTTTVRFNFEGQERVYEQVVPVGYDDSTRLPVVLNWHGLGSSGVEQLAFSDYTALADAEGFIVIVPTGLEDATGLNSWELAPEQFPDRDDLAFANTLLDQVIETLCVDDTRVYTTGMSNGGYFSSVLVCEMSDRIAAAASVAALSHADSCDPSRVVPYIGFHGTNDEVVPYDGSGESSMAPGQTVPLFALKILDEFAEFAAEAGCDIEPRVAQLSPQVTSFDFQNCADDVQMTFYEIEGGGHSWPGSAVSLAVSEAIGLGATTDEISASETSWAFFQQYSLDN